MRKKLIAQQVTYRSRAVRRLQKQCRIRKKDDEDETRIVGIHRPTKLRGIYSDLRWLASIGAETE
jgi:hypothetical protein